MKNKNAQQKNNFDQKITLLSITKNSPTKPDVPGNPEFAIANNIIKAAKYGILLTTPP